MSAIRPARLAFVALLAGLAAGQVGPALAQESADLAIAKEADRRQVRIGEAVTYTITVTNLGPAAATGVVFGDSVPDALNLVAFGCSQGTPVGSFCSLDRLEGGATATAVLVATPIPNLAKSERWVTNTAFVDAATPDPDAGNRTASVTVKVVGAPGKAPA